jgi:N-acetylmuramoyl-L-alanine amidase
VAKVFIDPGHGGRDPGAVGNGLEEKDLTLDISLRLARVINERYQGVEVRLSRKGDTFISLEDRADAANRWGADLVLSIHINAGGGTGFESYIHSSRPTTAAKWRHIIHQEVMAELGQEVRDRGMKTANFAILRQTRMPAVLTENLFIDHPEDSKRLKDPSFLQRLAEGYASALAKIFDLRTRGGQSSSDQLDDETIYYRVVAGSFTQREKAERRVKDLKEAGFDAFIDVYRN